MKILRTTLLLTIISLLIIFASCSFNIGGNPSGSSTSSSTSESKPAESDGPTESSSPDDPDETKPAESGGPTEPGETDPPDSGAGDVLGEWECVAESGNDKFVYILKFSGADGVSYTAGWYEGEIASQYDGGYSVENGVLSLDMAGSDGSLAGTFSVSVSGGKLVLTNESGDPLAFTFGKGVPMEFCKQ